MVWHGRLSTVREKVGGAKDAVKEAKNTAKKPFIGAENALWDIVGKVYISCHPQVPHAEGSLPS